MAVPSNEVLFLVGAGASRAFGIPTMKEMANMLKDNLEGSVGDIYRRIFETLEKNNKQGVDIEGVFTIIEYLRNKDKYVSQNDILSYNLGKSGLSLNDAGYDLTELQELNRKMRSFVRNACVLNSSNTSKLSEVYSHFFNSVSNALDGVPTHSNTSTKYDENWTIFTTNYDLCLETFWRDHTDIDLFTGFRRQEFSPNYFLYYSGSDLLNRNTGHAVMRLVKLHGSISWLRKKRDKKIIETQYSLDGSETIGRGALYEDEIVMYPLLEKHLYLDPYIQMFYCLNKEWQIKRTCVSIGYSFRDSIVANIFSTLMKEDKRKRIIIIHPHATDMVASVFDKALRDNFITIEKKFGESNYREVNEEITQRLSLL